MNQYAAAYKSVGLATASKERILLMMYEGAIRFVYEAKERIAEGNIAGKAERLSRVAAIMDALSAALDREQGGEVAENLSFLYTCINLHLTKANLTNDVALLDEVIRLLTTLYEGWVGAVRELSKPSASSSATEEPVSSPDVRRPMAFVG